MHWPQQTSALCRHTLPQNSDTCRLNWPGQCQNHDGANRTNNAEQTYRVVKEERSIVLEVKVSVIERSNSLYTCLNLSGYRHRAVWIYREIFFLFEGLDEQRNLQKNGGYTIRISRSRVGCCCEHKQIWRSTRTINARSSHSSYRVHLGWCWNIPNI